MNWQAEIKWFNPKDLIPYARNSKIHSKDQIDKLAQQIDKVGFHSPIVVDKEMVIIAGHARREAALGLCLESVPVIIANHLSEQDAIAARIADNKVASTDYDISLLAFDLGSLEIQGFDLKLTGLELDAANGILKEFNSEKEIQNEEKKEKPSQENKKHQCPECGFEFQ